MIGRSTILLVLTLGVAACAGVLGTRSKPSHPFEHRAHVNKGINCAECHAGVAGQGDEGPLHLPTTADCVRCHSKPHDQRTCSDCHGESHIRASAVLAREHLRFSHREHMPATRGDCIRCHMEVGLARPEALRPKMATCFSCHQHEKQWTMRDCDGCHVDLAAEDSPPQSHLVHEGDWIREHGVRAAGARDLCSSCHSERSCAACHGVGTVAALPSRLAFDQVRLAGLHRAGFRARHSDEARGNPGLCTTCHTERSCIDCHTRENVAPGVAARSPHPAGWLTTSRGGGQHGVQARLDPIACASCHGGAGEQLCVDCHRVGGPGGNPHGRGFSSRKDKVRDLPCRLCHGGGG
jgi:predicted CXXCH cytochrome family protein